MVLLVDARNAFERNLDVCSHRTIIGQRPSLVKECSNQNSNLMHQKVWLTQQPYGVSCFTDLEQ